MEYFKSKQDKPRSENNYFHKTKINQESSAVQEPSMPQFEKKIHSKHFLYFYPYILRNNEKVIQIKLYDYFRFTSFYILHNNTIAVSRTFRIKIVYCKIEKQHVNKPKTEQNTQCLYKTDFYDG